MNYNNTNLVYGCTGIKVYSPVTEPGATGSYTWRVKNGSPATFAEIVVPAGCESAYSSIDYWGKSKLTALQLEGIQLVEGSAKKVGGNLVISGRIAGTYDDATIFKWLETFYRRFFAQQFKRSCLPDGPKVGSVAVSPRGDLRMPSDACSRLWLKELEMIEKGER